MRLGSACARKGSRADRGRPRVLSLLRFLIVLAVLAGLGLAAIWALATFVEPRPREMSVTIPKDRLQQPGR